MPEQKIKQNNDSVADFLNKIDNDQRRTDCFELLKIMTGITGEVPKMWGTNMVGFGSYNYKTKSGNANGSFYKVGFSPRKQQISISILMGFEKNRELLLELGKHKTSVSCLHIGGLADVDKLVPGKLIRNSFDHMIENYR